MFLRVVFVLTHRWLPIIVILSYMAVVIVILLNILIAQMSDTYNEAKKLARLKYDVQRMHIITRLEHSRLRKLHRFVNINFFLLLSNGICQSSVNVKHGTFLHSRM